MKNFIPIINLIIYFLIKTSWCFFHKYDKIDLGENSKLLKEFKIVYDQKSFRKDRDKFPKTFSIYLEEFNQIFNASFSRVQANFSTRSSPNDIYVIDHSNNGNPTKYNLNTSKENDFEHYVQLDWHSNGYGFATLIRNPDGEQNSYRMIGTLYIPKDKDSMFSIIPINFDSGKRVLNKRETSQIKYDSVENHHVIHRRSNSFSPIDDFSFDKNSKFKEEIFKKINKQRIKRKVHNQPISFFVELLLVTDRSIYDDHARFLGSYDRDTIFTHMKIYYSHLINEVNQRYIYSLANDPHIRINVVLKNFLFLTDPSECEWSNPSKVGDPNFPTYNGKQVVLSSNCVGAFTDYMNSKTFDFEYDHAVGVFNKDIWSDVSEWSPRERASVAGRVMGIRTICSPTRYSIVEDIGGFTSINTIAHELGHNLGMTHDGESDNFCSPADNYIMSSTVSSYHPENLFKFSSCSINQLKIALLNNLYNAPSQTAECLLNIPTNLPIETSYANRSLTGLIWTVENRCKMLYGPSASFCIESKSQMCTLLACRKNINDYCISIPGGAVDGTLCDSGKVCMKGSCVNHNLAPYDECPFGDDIVYQEYTQIRLSSPRMTCSEVIEMIKSSGYSIYGLCQNDYFKQTCCQSCRKFKNVICADKILNCAPYKQICETGTLQGLIQGSVKEMCKRTCGLCITKPLRCEDDAFLCKNGGTCRNEPVDDYIGFKCYCASNFIGELCEKEQPCLNNPCKNGGSCILVGSSFMCKCLLGCTGFDCSSCQNGQKSIESNTINEWEIATEPVNQEHFSLNQITSSNSNQNQHSLDSNICFDFNPQLCSLYATRENCKNHHIIIKGLELEKYCAKSCQTCSTNKCVDLIPNCINANDLCRYFDKKLNPCKFTCNVCDDYHD